MRNSFSKKIFVTRPSRPSLIKLLFLVSGIVRRSVYTNDGPLLKSLEQQLSNLTGIRHVVCMNNGTSPLLFLNSLISPNSLVATTPYTFVASAAAIQQSGNQPAWIDINISDLNMDVSALSNSPNIKSFDAILATHVFGNLCDIDSIGLIAKKLGVPFFIDAAHCMSDDFSDYEILGSADACTLSFHATKIFSTGEGGALLTNDPEIAEKARSWRNFGIQNGNLSQLGQNAKLSELGAALGLANLPRLSKEVRRRRKLSDLYLSRLGEIESLACIQSKNYSYFPVLLPSEAQLLKVLSLLEQKNIYPRRYFYPSLSEVPFLAGYGKSTKAEDAAKRSLCLPLGTDVKKKTVAKITKVICECLGEL